MYKTNGTGHLAHTVYLIQRIGFNVSVSEYLRHTVSQMKEAFFSCSKIKEIRFLPYSMACLV